MNKMELSFIFHEDSCIQCHGCETACSSWNNLPFGIHRRRVINLWHGSFPNVTCSSLSLSCFHCTYPACVEICPVQAISKDKVTGIVTVDSNLCFGCTACKKACPFEIVQFGPDSTMDKCTMCQTKLDNSTQEVIPPPCVRTCPTQALELKWLSVSDKQQIEQHFLQQNIKLVP